MLQEIWNGISQNPIGKPGLKPNTSTGIDNMSKEAFVEPHLQQIHLFTPC